MSRLTERDGRIAVRVGGCTKRHDPVFDKLAHYEDLEEAGRLIELPCKVGDTVYYIDDGEIYYDKVSSIEISKEKGEYIFGIAFMDWKAEDFGKKVFLSEAEVYMAELKDGDGDE